MPQCLPIFSFNPYRHPNSVRNKYDIYFQCRAALDLIIIMKDITLECVRSVKYKSSHAAACIYPPGLSALWAHGGRQNCRLRLAIGNDERNDLLGSEERLLLLPLIIFAVLIGVDYTAAGSQPLMHEFTDVAHFTNVTASSSFGLQDRLLGCAEVMTL